MGFAKPAPNSADVGLVGLAVMGQNLVLNMADHGFKVAVYNRTTATTQKFVDDNPPSVFGDSGGGLVPGAELSDFVALRYDNPPGGRKTCLNSKIASARVTLTRKGSAPVTLTTQSRAAFEILTERTDHGVPVLAV